MDVIKDRYQDIVDQLYWAIKYCRNRYD